MVQQCYHTEAVVLYIRQKYYLSAYDTRPDIKIAKSARAIRMRAQTGNPLRLSILTAANVIGRSVRKASAFREDAGVRDPISGRSYLLYPPVASVSTDYSSARPGSIAAVSAAAKTSLLARQRRSLCARTFLFSLSFLAALYTVSRQWLHRTTDAHYNTTGLRCATVRIQRLRSGS